MSKDGKSFQQDLTPCKKLAALSYAATGIDLNLIEKNIFYSRFSLQPQLLEGTFFVLCPPVHKGNSVNLYLKLIPLGAVLALVMASVSAQTAAPAGTASAPATLGVTPQEAAKANQQAIPRSDTATVVRTAPSPAQRASAALNGNTTAMPSGTGTAGTTAMNSGTTGSGNGSLSGTRRARADRN